MSMEPLLRASMTTGAGTYGDSYDLAFGIIRMPAMAATHTHVGMNPSRIRPTEDIFNANDPHIREARNPVSLLLVVVLLGKVFCSLTASPWVVHIGHHTDDYAISCR